MKYILLAIVVTLSGCSASYMNEHDHDYCHDKDHEMIVDEEYTGPMPFMPVEH